MSGLNGSGVTIIIIFVLAQAELIEFVHIVREAVHYKFCNKPTGFALRTNHVCSSEWKTVEKLEQIEFPNGKEERSFTHLFISLAWSAATTLSERDIPNSFIKLRNKGLNIAPFNVTHPKPQRIEAATILKLQNFGISQLSLSLETIEIPNNIDMYYFETWRAKEIKMPKNGTIGNLGIYNFNGHFDAQIPDNLIDRSQYIVIYQSNMNCSCAHYQIFKKSHQFKVFLPESACIAPPGLNTKQFHYITDKEYLESNGGSCGDVHASSMIKESWHVGIGDHYGLTIVDLYMMGFILGFKLIFGSAAIYVLSSSCRSCPKAKLPQSLTNSAIRLRRYDTSDATTPNKTNHRAVYVPEKQRLSSSIGCSVDEDEIIFENIAVRGSGEEEGGESSNKRQLQIRAIGGVKSKPMKSEVDSVASMLSSHI